jgi:hypothetical protein
MTQLRRSGFERKLAAAVVSALQHVTYTMVRRHYGGLTGARAPIGLSFLSAVAGDRDLCRTKGPLTLRYPGEQEKDMI